METFVMIVLTLIFFATFLFTVGIIVEGIDTVGVMQDIPNILLSIYFLYSFGFILFIAVKFSYLVGVAEGEAIGEQNQLKGTPKYKMEVRYALDEFNCPIPTDTVFVDIK